MSGSYLKYDLLSVPYVNPPQMYTATTVLPAVGIILVLLRLHRRYSSNAGLSMDDWLLVPALVCGASIRSVRTEADLESYLPLDVP
jgi:hypothetical protein